ncbi:MAG: sulfur carrier protein ThiS [Cellvibrionales bacterium]|nr:sulfur carrier protein ThiS [Cellvibrionales bacterium]
MLTLSINGKTMQVPPLESLQALIRHLDYQPSQIAVAINMQFIPKNQYAQTPLNNNDNLEILSAVQGG